MACLVALVQACAGPAVVRPSTVEPEVPLVCEPGQGEPGSVTGHVSAADPDEPLAFCSVSVWNTDIGSNIEPDGSYAIRGVLTPGRYTLLASALGFEERRALVEVRPGETTVVDFRLESSEVLRPIDVRH